MKPIPIALSQQISDYTKEQIFGGCSSSEVFRLTQAKQPTLFLKIAPIQGEKTLLPEKERLEWLHQRLPVPQLYNYLCTESDEYLLISEIMGRESYHPFYSEDISTVVQKVAEGLRLIHSQPIDNCPFDTTLDRLIGVAQDRVEKGLVNEFDFDAHRQGRSATSLFQELLARRPTTEDIVLTHGDYCLPNILLHKEQLSGFIDLGLFGYSDRYRDLALATRSLIRNWGEEWVDLLFQEYGVDADEEMIDYYCLLDEFF